MSSLGFVEEAACAWAKLIGDVGTPGKQIEDAVPAQNYRVAGLITLRDIVAGPSYGIA